MASPSPAPVPPGPAPAAKPPGRVRRAVTTTKERVMSRKGIVVLVCVGVFGLLAWMAGTGRLGRVGSWVSSSTPAPASASTATEVNPLERPELVGEKVIGQKISVYKLIEIDTGTTPKIEILLLPATPCTEEATKTH